MSTIAIISAVIMVIGIVGYMYEYTRGAVGRFTGWRELTLRQVVFFAMAAQAYVIIPILLIIKLNP